MNHPVYTDTHSELSKTLEMRTCPLIVEKCILHNSNFQQFYASWLAEFAIHTFLSQSGRRICKSIGTLFLLADTFMKATATVKHLNVIRHTYVRLLKKRQHV